MKFAFARVIHHPTRRHQLRQNGIEAPSSIRLQSAQRKNIVRKWHQFLYIRSNPNLNLNLNLPGEQAVVRRQVNFSIVTLGSVVDGRARLRRAVTKSREIEMRLDRVSPYRLLNDRDFPLAFS